MLETIVMNSGITQKANQKNGLNLKDYFHFFAISFSLIWQKMKKRSKPKYRVFRQVPESITTRNRKSNKLNYLHIGLLSIDVSRFLSRCSSRQWNRLISPYCKTWFHFWEKIWKIFEVKKGSWSSHASWVILKFYFIQDCPQLVDQDRPRGKWIY